jgi:hypothetical protein
MLILYNHSSSFTYILFPVLKGNAMLSKPNIDPAPIVHHLRAAYQTQILVAAVNRLMVLEKFAGGPQSLSNLMLALNLKERPAMVLFPALCAMGILQKDSTGNLDVTQLGRYLMSSSEPNLIGYLGLGADDPSVANMAELLKHDGPIDSQKGIAYVMDSQQASPMDDPALARYLTMALAGRAKHLAPLVAPHLPKGHGHLLDVAGGTGFYTYEYLLLNPDATATVFDRPEVLKVATECMEHFCASGRPGANSIKSRLRFKPGDMLVDLLPQADILLAFSLFHDWPTETCIQLATRFGMALNPQGELWVHDAFLNDTLDGPLAVTDYSSQLFAITKGRCYSRKEHFEWFMSLGLLPSPELTPTQMDYGLISARKL